MNLSLTKKELRAIYKEKRMALSKDEAFLLSKDIFNRFLAFFQPISGQKVHIFIPIEKFKEMDTQIFIDYFLEHQIRVFVPKMLGEELISVEIFTSTKFEENLWNIVEPVSNEDSGVIDFDFVIAPLLYCDKKGNRVGYGKGFYDGFFETISPNTKKIGVNYFNPDVDIDDLWEKDIPLDYLVTPTDVLSFSGASE